MFGGAAKPEQCQSICQEFPECRFWTYISEIGICFLKIEAGRKLNRLNAVSGKNLLKGLKQKDRRTERRRDGETERQKDRETERRRDRSTQTLKPRRLFMLLDDTGCYWI